MVSNFELHVRNGAPDTRDSFCHFASTQFDAYHAFTRKWVHSDFAASQLVLLYDDLQSDPSSGLARAVSWIDPATDPDPDRIAAAVAQVDGEQIERGRVTRLERTGVHAARRIEEFRHYRPDLFTALARMRLTRDAVSAVFEEVLGRTPEPRNMVNFQAMASTDALQRALMQSEEYARRMAAQTTADTPDA